LTEIGRYCGGFNEFVIAKLSFLLVFTAIAAEMRLLPWAATGAIIGPTKGGAA
jgi:hypothetical protein